ncbi:hypothetical protein CMUS01_15818 [Colletotrichum musicola]|uniref:Uncharacterized protein n=1 Tax=Colletotrichum musicola TaxID=2175873 RepID=A0A8H6MLU0_9PEZI|nr:hypothetical protein CMUS01_15818 [Colletotrichum musicola]
MFGSPSEAKTVITALTRAYTPSSTATVTDISCSDEYEDRRIRKCPNGRRYQDWKFEFLALLIALFSFGSMVTILGTYHKQPQPGFAYKTISINTIISIFSTILRTTLLFISAEAIGQSKWWWMKTPRPLRHIEVGSHINPKINSAAINGFMFGKDYASPTSSKMFQCQSGNCTFASRAGITHTSWTDTTDSITTFTTAGSSYPNHPRSRLDSTRDRRLRQKQDNLSKPVGNIFNGEIGVIAANCSLSPCLRHYHGAVVNGVLDEREVSQEPLPIATMVGGPHNDTYGWFIKMMEPCIFQGNWYDSTNITLARRDETWLTFRIRDEFFEMPYECTRVLSPWTIDGTRMFLNYTLLGPCWLPEDETDVSNILGGEAGEYTDLLDYARCKTWWVTSLYKGGNVTFGDISSAFDGMAKAMTNWLRAEWGLNTWNSTLGSFGLGDPAFVNGSVSHNAICISAVWLWLAYPGLLLLLTMALLVSTCIRSYATDETQPVWKSSILPLLFYGISKEHSTIRASDRQPELGLVQLSELERLADGTVARFDGKESGPRFVVTRTGLEGSQANGDRPAAIHKLQLR